MKQMKLSHLTREQHLEAARLLIEAQERLDAVARAIGRAPYTDASLMVAKRIQETLIDQLRQAWDDMYAEHSNDWRDNPYPSVGYYV
jgi:hypothetical protein